MIRLRPVEVAALVVVVFIVSAIGAAIYFTESSDVSVNTYCPKNSCTYLTNSTARSSTTVVLTNVTYTSTQISTTVTAQDTSNTTTSSAGTSRAMRLGFWLQEQDIMEHYSAPQFFDAMFLTPPYPSTMELMVFAILQDEMNHDGCASTTPYVNGSLDYWGQVAQMADSYPNIRLIFEVAFNATSTVYGLVCFRVVAQDLAKYPSVYGIGIDGEYTYGKNQSTYLSAMGYVKGTGKQFINYYAPDGDIPSGGYDIAHTNFPAQGDQVHTLSDFDAQTIGISSGYYEPFPFPSNFTCPIWASEVASGPLSNEPQGYNQCVVSTEISTAVSFLNASARQFLELVPGFSSNSTFIGVSGELTSQLWDSPVLRGWIWSDPDYTSNFTLSVYPLT